jgi:hypothetical protein
MSSNPAQDMDVCNYSLFVLSCVGSGYVTGSSPVQGTLPTVCKINISELNKIVFEEINFTLAAIIYL